MEYYSICKYVLLSHDTPQPRAHQLTDPSPAILLERQKFLLEGLASNLDSPYLEAYVYSK